MRFSKSELTSITAGQTNRMECANDTERVAREQSVNFTRARVRFEHFENATTRNDDLLLFRAREVAMNDVCDTTGPL